MVVGKDKELRQHLLSLFHKSPMGGHSGILATTKRISQLFYWKGLRKDTRK